jgi:Bacterial regulatory proteins, luxR family
MGRHTSLAGGWSWGLSRPFSCGDRLYRAVSAAGHRSSPPARSSPVWAEAYGPVTSGGWAELAQAGRVARCVLHQQNHQPARGALMDQTIAISQSTQCCCHTEHFTERETGILRQVAAGDTNDAIATRLNISGHTVAHPQPGTQPGRVSSPRLCRRCPPARHLATPPLRSPLPPAASERQLTAPGQRISPVPSPWPVVPVRAENLVHGYDQQGCSPGRPAVMITDHVPAVRIPPDYAGRRGIAAVAA